MNKNPASPTVASNGKAANRAAAFKARQADKGLVQANVWVPSHMLSELQILARALCEDPDLALGPLRNVRSGKLVKFN